MLKTTFLLYKRISPSFLMGYLFFPILIPNEAIIAQLCFVFYDQCILYLHHLYLFKRDVLWESFPSSNELKVML